MRRLADGLWHWTARHPEWHGTSEFSASVGCYLAHADGRTILIDPLLTEDIDDLEPVHVAQRLAGLGQRVVDRLLDALRGGARDLDRLVHVIAHDGRGYHGSAASASSSA